MKGRSRAVVLALVGLSGALAALAACFDAATPDGMADSAPSCPAVSTDCPSTPPSWAKDVQPIIENYCITCHEPGGNGEALADLTSYAYVYRSRSSILTQVYQCLMPNQDASPPPPELTTDQRETIVAWVACNAPNN